MHHTRSGQDKTSLDYAGPVYIKQGHVQKPTMVKGNCMDLHSLSVKAVHLELVSDIGRSNYLFSVGKLLAQTLPMQLTPSWQLLC